MEISTNVQQNEHRLHILRVEADRSTNSQTQDPAAAAGGREKERERERGVKHTNTSLRGVPNEKEAQWPLEPNPESRTGGRAAGGTAGGEQRGSGATVVIRGRMSWILSAGLSST